jgi:DNA-binding NarL/FixJ family response regulator
MTLGLTVMRWGELERAPALLEEAVTLQRASGDAADLASSLLGLGITAMLQQDYERAAALHEEGLALARQAEDDFAINLALMQGALASLSRGKHRRARALSEEGLALAWRLRMLPPAAHLNISAALAGSGGQAVRSARLWGAAESLRETIGAALSPIESSYFAPHNAAALAKLGKASWEAARTEGQAMIPEQAVEYTIDTHEAAPASAQNTVSSLLSEREMEVLRLAAEGLTNPEVAERLYLSPRTVGQHLRSAYRKLGVS